MDSIQDVLALPPCCQVGFVVPNLEEAIALARSTDECPFIIGGASLYQEALPIATELHLTTVDQDVEGDTYFPEDLSEFVEVERRAGESEGVTFQLMRRHADPAVSPTE
mgnify:CR=1 FL=1